MNTKISALLENSEEAVFYLPIDAALASGMGVTQDEDEALATGELLIEDHELAICLRSDGETFFIVEGSSIEDANPADTIALLYQCFGQDSISFTDPIDPSLEWEVDTLEATCFEVGNPAKHVTYPFTHFTDFLPESPAELAELVQWWVEETRS